jgi:hypothetical protein
MLTLIGGMWASAKESGETALGVGVSALDACGFVENEYGIVFSDNGIVCWEV